MTWMEKLELTVQRRPTCHELKLCFASEDVGATVAHIGVLKNTYPFLPDRYLDLLLKHDGIYIAFFMFFGFCSKGFRTMEKARNLWRDFDFDFSTACLFAEDAGGNPLFIHDDGSIWLYFTDPPDERKRVCSNFDELMGDGFFGAKYMTMLNVLNPISEEENCWLKYLRDSGWHQ